MLTFEWLLTNACCLKANRRRRFIVNLTTLLTKRIMHVQATSNVTYFWPSASSDAQMLGEELLSSSTATSQVQRVLEKIEEHPELKAEILLAGISMCMSDKKGLAELVVKVGRLLDHQSAKDLM